MSAATALLPCPFCGSRSPFTYITFSCAVLRCQCGATLEHAAAQVMYKKEELPEALIPHAYEATGLVIQAQDGTRKEWPEHGYIGVNAMGAFEHAGITARWNRRYEAAA